MDHDKDSFLNHLSNVGEDEYKIRMERPVTVRVAEVRNLPKGVNGTWVEIVVENESKVAGRTPTKFFEKNPFFGEDISLNLTNDDLILHVILRKENILNKKSQKKKGTNGIGPGIGTELGRVTINLDEIQPGDNWYSLCNNSSKKGAKNQNIDIRLSISYNEIIILPSHKYTKLLNMLLDKTSDFKVIMTLATSGEIKSKEAVDLAELLVQICDFRENRTPDIINLLLSHDIRTADCKETLFRGNSVGTKALDYYMKWIATRWLDCLRPLVQTIIISDRCCEVREAKLKEKKNGGDLKTNAKNLEEFFDVTTKFIFNSQSQCPLPLRRIFHHIRKEVEKVFPEEEDVGYTAVTGFLFLRFFVPAIMTPKLFGLAGDYSTGNTERTFTLVATLLQKLANLQLFEQHEAHFDLLNPILLKQQENMKKFVDFISNTDTPKDEEAICVEHEVDIDLMVARLCSHISSHMKPLEDELPAKFIALFLAELEAVFEEMKFLLKKFKKDQIKRRHGFSLVSSRGACVISAPSTPPVTRKSLSSNTFKDSSRPEVERVKRRHSFSLDRIALVKSNKVKDRLSNSDRRTDAVDVVSTEKKKEKERIEAQ